MKETIEKAIWAHSRWKTHLRQAIETGKSHVTAEEVRNPHTCAFGQWLNSKEGKHLLGYHEILELHIKFHEEASHILSLALTGQTNEATAKMQVGSKFNQLTAKLVNKLAEIG